MTDKQKLALKIVLFVTVPIWFPLMVAALVVSIPFLIVWCMVDEIVEPSPRFPMGAKRGP